MDHITAMRIVLDMARAYPNAVDDEHMEAMSRVRELLAGLEDGSVNIE